MSGRNGVLTRAEGSDVRAPRLCLSGDRPGHEAAGVASTLNSLIERGAKTAHRTESPRSAGGMRSPRPAKHVRTKAHDLVPVDIVSCSVELARKGLPPSSAGVEWLVDHSAPVAWYFKFADFHEPDMHAAILGALRLNGDRSERQRGGDRRIGGRRDGNADHCLWALAKVDVRNGVGIVPRDCIGWIDPRRAPKFLPISRLLLPE